MAKKQKQAVIQKPSDELDAEMSKEYSEEAVDMLRELEKEMYNQGDVRSNIIRQALDLLEFADVATPYFKPTVLTMANASGEF